MKRRSFLGLLGIAPVAAFASKAFAGKPNQQKVSEIIQANKNTFPVAFHVGRSTSVASDGGAFRPAYRQDYIMVYSREEAYALVPKYPKIALWLKEQGL